MANEQQLEPLYELFETSSAEVFESLGCQASRVASAPEKLEVPCAYIEARSEELHIVLLLRGPVEFLEQTHPNIDQAKGVSVQDLDDWISELANRFMGSLKNKLLVYDHRLKLGTPTSEYNVDLQRYNQQGFCSRVHYYQSEREVFECGLYCKLLVDDIHFIYHDAHSYDQTDDGDLEIF